MLTVGGLGDTIDSLVLRHTNLGPTTFVLVARVFFLIVGMPMDAVPAILIFLPVLLPVATDLGVGW